MWYEIFVDDEFLDYFGNDNNVFFTIEDGKEVLAPTFLRFRKIVSGVTRAFAHQSRAEYWMNELRDIGEYDMLQGFKFCFERISSLNFGKYHLVDIWHSIPRGERSKYDVDTDDLSAEQCAVLIMYPFWGRMGIRDETSFQSSGSLKRFLFVLKEKVDKARQENRSN